MRKYYTASIPRFEVNTPRVLHFCWKYSFENSQLRCNKIGVRRKGDLEYIYIHNLYFYSEGDILYEFFTGKELGKVQENSRYFNPQLVYDYNANPYYVESNEYGYISLETSSVDGFSYHLKEHMQYAQKFKTAMDEYFIALQSSRAKANRIAQTVAKEKALDEAKRQTDTPSVESFLDSRKNT